MKTIQTAVLLSAFIALPTLALADDENQPGFEEKGGDYASHVEVHTHSHPEVRDAPATPTPFKDRGADVVRQVEVHMHSHPEVRASGDPETPAEPFGDKE